MTIFITVLVCFLISAFVVIGVLTFFYKKNLADLERLEAIEDKEAYMASCEQKASDAIAQQQRAVEEFGQHKANYVALVRKINTAKKEYAPYKSADEFKGLIQEREAKCRSLAKAIDGLQGLSELQARIQYSENYLAELETDIGCMEEAKELATFGYYASHYDFESSEEYKERLDEVRQDQKGQLKDGTACVGLTEWVVDGSKTAGRKMANEQIKLMLRAFNGECDAAILKAKFNNLVSLDKRIKKSFDAINKLGKTKQIILSDGYLELKLQELQLNHEYKVKKQEEKEEQARIRELMREEEKVQREIEKAKKEAEKEEAVKRDALEKARAELKAQEGANTEKMRILVAKLESELKDALDRKAKAIARAQLTRSGHVYILSNIGSFGDDIYKIGLTRRLDPNERVKELASASVPFPFDVHAMIYCEDAPSLEKKLHKYFDEQRVNLVNSRKEFFQVSLSEIQQAIEEVYGRVTFITTAVAEQYRQTVAKKRAPESSKVDEDMVAVG